MKKIESETLDGSSGCKKGNLRIRLGWVNTLINNPLFSYEKKEICLSLLQSVTTTDVGVSIRRGILVRFRRDFFFFLGLLVLRR